MPVNFRWATGVPATGWNVGFETLEFSSLATEYVVIPVAATKAGVAYDPTGDVVQFAFMPTATQVPATADWVTGSWETAATSIIYPYNARCLVGPATASSTALTGGSYTMYLKITDSPEIPVLVIGTLAII